MEETLIIEKGTIVSRLRLMAELLKDFNNLDLTEEKQDELQKLFNGSHRIAKKSFKISVKIEVLK